MTIALLVAASVALALIVFLLSSGGAPEIRQGLSESWWTWPLQIATAISAISAIWFLWTRKFKLARVCAAQARRFRSG